MLNKLEEMKLLALCMAADNRDAFSRLVVAYQDQLRRFILNLAGGDASLTDDLAQETFLKAWLGIRSFKGISGFKTWLYRIAINEFVSYRRKFSATTSHIEDSYAAGICDDNNIHQATEAKMDVASLLKTLSDPERIVTLLFYLEDIPIKKICKITSMPEGTVKSHLSRARVHMAKILKTK